MYVYNIHALKLDKKSVKTVYLYMLKKYYQKSICRIKYQQKIFICNDIK